jgi:hypothetical protein
MTSVCHLPKFRDLALQHRRYFIGTGIGFSGWIISREFLLDFLELYGTPSSDARPDVVGWQMLAQKRQWTVTRPCFVSHSLQRGIGSKALTVSSVDNGKPLKKHLPRGCLEPHRAKWTDANSRGGDMYGWDHFDYEACPDSEIYPCSDAKRLVYHEELHALKTPPPIQTSDTAKMELLSSSPGNTTDFPPRNKRDTRVALAKEASSNKNNVKQRLPIPMSNASQMGLSLSPGNTTASSPRNKRDVVLLDALVVKESRNENNVKNKRLPIRASNSSESVIFHWSVVI